jgi:hypothetical protein
MMISGRRGWCPTGTAGRAMLVAEEQLFPGRKMNQGDFGREGAGPSKCGNSGEGGRCVVSDHLTYAGGGDAKGDGVGGARSESSWSGGGWEKHERRGVAVV